MRNALWPACILGGFLVGCADDQAGFSAKTIQAPDSAQERQQYLERRHTVTIDVPEKQIESAFQATVAACNNDRKLECTLLDSELTRAQNTTASITVRLIPSGVEPLIVLAAANGTIESRSTHTTDLAKPIIDAEQRLAMLDGYMDDLQRLRQQSRSNVDALIKVTSEIAKTQSEIESLKGEHAHLRQRVDLQVLSLQFVSNLTQSFSSPIVQAFGDFGRDFTSGVAQAITGFAYLVPWLFILVPLAFLFRYLWRRFR